ncbi:MAG TPA: methanogenesis marker 17 protein [Methanomassiliicoccales archaeon]|nr:methanogenesis marker 17 protein [Methanomassiliicoccales archaeon]
MKVTVEGQEDWGNQSYDELFRRILLDLGITRMIDEVHMIIEPENSFFLISLRVRTATGAKSIHEVAKVEQKPEGAMLTITNELYAPRLLALLWRDYGRQRVDQLSRFELMVRGIKIDELEEKMLDPGEELKQKVLDAVWRLLPEGLKVRHNIYSEGVLTIAATEHDMKQDWKDLAEKIHAELESGREEV